MIAVYARAVVHALRLRDALARHWRRILVGAFCGWLTSTVLGAAVLAWLEVRGTVQTPESGALFGAAAVWGGTALGAVAAYAARPELRKPRDQVR